MVRFVSTSSLFAAVAHADVCLDDDAELDLCHHPLPIVTLAPDDAEEDNAAVRRVGGPGALFALGLMLVNGKGPLGPLMMSSFFLGGAAAGETGGAATTCKHVKDVYKAHECCGSPEKQVQLQMVPGPKSRLAGTNGCAGKKPNLANINCTVNGVIEALEQAGADVTKNHEGTLTSTVSASSMIKTAYYKNGLCPVNVHWHLGTEHRSEGEYDETGTGPGKAGHPNATGPARRLGAGHARYGYACKKYQAGEAKFNTDYNWQHCVGMHVGETYEVHWPHSKLGACGSPDQYQTPFYDGVFCGYDGSTALSGDATASHVGVQSQVFVIVNDENYYYPDLMRGMIVDQAHADEYGKDIAIYTGSTTGTSRSNSICSAYTPITWQVDRKCHLISASSFDKMCADMKQQRDDMSTDLEPHGSRIVVTDELTANNLMDHTYQVPTQVR